MRIVLFCLAIFYSGISNACDRVVTGYEKSDSMFVICEDLSLFSVEDASELIIGLFNQYKGPPDEVAIYFVTGKNFVGNLNIQDDNLVGFYYTHDNNLIIWPNSKNELKTLQVVWK